MKSITADDINGIPNGDRYVLVFIAVVKAWLAREIETEFRLKFLEWLDKCSTEYLNFDAVAAVDPMPAAGLEIVYEAQKLGAAKSLDVFASHDVFSAFVVINPSMLKAERLKCGWKD